MGTEADELTTIGLRVPRAVLISDLFAGAAESEELLPEVCDVHRTVVIVGLRDQNEIGSTFVRIIERYAKKLDSTGNKLMLAEVESC